MGNASSKKKPSRQRATGGNAGRDALPSLSEMRGTLGSAMQPGIGANYAVIGANTASATAGAGFAAMALQHLPALSATEDKAALLRAIFDAVAPRCATVEPGRAAWVALSLLSAASYESANGAAVFAAIDEAGTGAISAADLRRWAGAFLAILDPDAPQSESESAAFAADALSAVDLDHDAALSLVEWLHWFHFVIDAPPRLPSLTALRAAMRTAGHVRGADHEIWDALVDAAHGTEGTQGTAQLVPLRSDFVRRACAAIPPTLPLPAPPWTRRRCFGAIYDVAAHMVSGEPGPEHLLAALAPLMPLGGEFCLFTVTFVRSF